GDSRQALRAHRAAARVYAARGATRSLGKSLHNAGLAYFQLGEYPAAIETLERALAAKRNPDPRIRDPLGECRSLQTLGQVYTRLGDVQRAESLLEAAEKLLADGGPPAERVRTIASLASAYERDEDYESAEKAYEASLAIELDERHAWLRERIRAALASVYVRQERFAEAEAVLRPALERLEALADRDGAAHAMVTLAVALSRSGRPEAALAQLAEARARAEELDDTRLVSETWAAESWARHRQGHNVQAMEAATEAIVTSRRILTGLAAAQSATIRARHLTPFQVGMEAAADENAAARFVSFLESGRAGALLEGLEARDELMRAGVPAPLRERLDRARSAEALARHAYLDAVRTNADRRTRGKLARAHHALRAKTLLAVEAIQRDRKAQVAADLLYPQPATLEAIQQVLDDGDAMILYGFAEKRIYAVVVTRQGADIHALGARRPIEEACAALRFDEATIDPLPAMSALRKQLVDPLGLKQQIQRVLISPAGCLHRLPFRIWFPDRTLVHIPSATTYRLLRNQDEQPGEGVLALADPAYEAHRGHARLEGSGAEARAITDDVFLREAATESRLRAALAARGDKRLRALHLAAHGRLDRRRPLQAHIALAADEHNDGDLTALEVFEMRIPADLVVASACYTGAGAVYEGEGLIGFTRAFMYAGAPRVLVSLWAVPDDATRALMIEFYRRWRPRDGRPARSAAEALRDAQAHIRAQPKWRHPMHWAAWVLWGRAD
nr:CHAT domain-containing protein [Planctomycetota bacterium]